MREDGSVELKRTLGFPRKPERAEEEQLELGKECMETLTDSCVRSMEVKGQRRPENGKYRLMDYSLITSGFLPDQFSTSSLALSKHPL
ncbi:hypothetical protein MHYP_G00322900 [Metynnis hypsauchen]